MGSVPQMRCGNCDKIPQDGPPQVSAKVTGCPRPQSVYVPFAVVVMADMIDSEMRCSENGAPGVLIYKQAQHAQAAIKIVTFRTYVRTIKVLAPRADHPAAIIPQTIAMTVPSKWLRKPSLPHILFLDDFSE